MYIAQFLLSILTALGIIGLEENHRDNGPAHCPINATYKFMSTKTSYDLIGNKSNLKDYSERKCRQIGLWHLSRHGQRFPDRDDIIEMNDILPKLKAMILQTSKLFKSDAICPWLNTRC